VVALEDREAPQLAMLLPFAAEAAGVAVLAASALAVSHAPAYAADFADFRMAGDEAANVEIVNRTAVVHADAVFAATQTSADAESGDFNSLANLDRKDRNDLSRSPFGERGASVIPALTPAIEGSISAPCPPSRNPCHFSRLIL
jgi:hypothetical protein